MPQHRAQQLVGQLVVVPAQARQAKLQQDRVQPRSQRRIRPALAVRVGHDTREQRFAQALQRTEPGFQ